MGVADEESALQLVDSYECVTPSCTHMQPNVVLSHPTPGPSHPPSLRRSELQPHLPRTWSLHQTGKNLWPLPSACCGMHEPALTRPLFLEPDTAKTANTQSHVACLLLKPFPVSGLPSTVNILLRRPPLFAIFARRLRPAGRFAALCNGHASTRRPTLCLWDGAPRSASYLALEAGPRALKGEEPLDVEFASDLPAISAAQVAAVPAHEEQRQAADQHKWN